MVLKYHIEYISSRMFNELLLIRKKNLPKLELFNYNNLFNSKNIIHNYYYCITDLNENSEMRKSIALSNSWINEKNNQDNSDIYLKQRCRVQLLMNVRYKANKEAKYQVIDL